MARCEECIHNRVCVIPGCPSAFENTHWKKEPCDHFKDANVVPRAELAREIFEEIAKIKKEYASGDIDGDTLYVRLYLLEKKYTEATP